MMMIRLFALVFMTLLAGTPAIAGPSDTAEPVDPALVSGLKQLQQLDQRLHQVGYRLTTENASFCEEQTYRSGLLLHDIAQYGDQSAARQAFGFDTPIIVNAVAGISAAQFQIGDGIIAINNQNLADVATDTPELALEKPGYRRLVATNQLIVRELGSRINFRNSDSFISYVRHGEQLGTYLVPARACASQFQIRPDRDRKAFADGRMVTITSALADYVESDDELAAIAAHELAHNLLKHKERLNAQKVNRGFFGQFGKSAGRIKATEIEADRLSVWLMKNAGYDPEAAIRFWTRYGKQYGKGIFSASTHYRWKKRVKLFEEEIANMAAAPTSNGKLAPPLLATNPP